MSLVLNGTDGLSDVDGSAATPAIRGTDANTGIFFPGADRIGFSEGGVQVGEFDASGNFQMNSGYGSVATVYGCRAWVNFNGTGTVAIRASGNVTSITDNGTGDYTINFTNAMPDANYSLHGTTVHQDNFDANVTAVGLRDFYTPTATSARISVNNSNNQAGGYSDRAYVYVAIFR